MPCARAPAERHVRSGKTIPMSEDPARARRAPRSTAIPPVRNSHPLPIAMPVPARVGWRVTSAPVPGAPHPRHTMKSSLAVALLFATSLVAQRTPATSATFTNFGTPCGADLNGSVSSTIQISLGVSNAAASAFGFLGIGQPATNPHPLPVGTCSVLLDNRIFLGGRFFMTDASGAATLNFRGTPPAGLNISFQAVVISIDRTNRTFTVDATNGTTLVTQ